MDIDDIPHANLVPLDEIKLLHEYLVPMLGMLTYPPREIGTARIQIKHGIEAFDDCAVIEIGNVALVVGTDYVRGTEFSLFEKGLMGYRDIGYFLAVANISDVVAMGALPFALLSVIRYSKEMTEQDFVAILEGLNEAAQKYRTNIIGGDTGSAKESVLAATALGFCEHGDLLLRKNIAAEQMICVTGTIGRAFAARVYFEYAKPKGLRLNPDLEETLLCAWRRPNARLSESLILRKSAKSCQDVSDGLKATIEQLVLPMHLGAEIYEDSLPIDEATTEVANFCGIPPAQLAMSASTDFELVCTVPNWKLQGMLQEFEEQKLRISVIGKTDQTGKCSLVRNDGTRVTPLPGVAWKSQFEDIISQVIVHS